MNYKGKRLSKRLITKDGYIELVDKEITALKGKTAHEVYFHLLRLFRETLNINKQDELENCVFELLNNKKVIELQEILEIV